MSAGSQLEAGPYRGLRPFSDSDLDALLFFGRERERTILTANLLAARLTVLYGPSGVGKSSLVRAGVVHELRAAIAEESGAGKVVVYERWTGDPRAGIASAIEQECGPLGPAAGLADAAAAATQRIGGPLYLILDQFEEYFLYHGAGPLATDLPELVDRPGLEVNVLVSLRDDALSQLDVFKPAIPNLFANALRLDRLDRQGARRAIVAPLERYGELAGKELTIEPELVEEVLDQVAVERFDSEGGAGAAGSGRDEIEAPYLQLVLERLWEEETKRGSPVLRLSTLRDLGGAEAIVRDHLESALAGLNDRQLDATAVVLNQLVTPSGTKIAHRPEDLAGYAQLPPGELKPLLGKLVDERILRTIEASGTEPERCEIFHDVLAGPITAWRSSWAVERERRAAARQRRRLLALSAGALAALLVVAAIAVFALVQRSHARADARRAQARELAANALVKLPVDGEAAVGLALRGARLAPSLQTEEVLRKTLVGSYERAVVRVGSPVVSASFNRTGNRLLAASAKGLVRVFDRQGRVLWSRRVSNGLTAAFFAPDGSVVAAAGSEVRVWSVDGGRVLKEVRFPKAVTSIAVAAGKPRSTLLVGQPSEVRLVSLSGGGERRLSTPGKPVSLEVSPDGGLLAAIVTDETGQGRAAVYDLRSGGLLHVLTGRGVEAIAFGPRGRLLATGSTKLWKGFPTAQLWDPRSGELLQTLFHKGRVLAFAFSPDGRRFATGSADGATRIWDAKTGTRLLLLAGPIGTIDSLAFSANGRFLIAGSSDRTARVYEVDNGRERAVLTGDRDAVTQVALSPDEKLALTGSVDGTARIWDPDVVDQLQSVDRTGGPVREVSFSPDGKMMLIARDRSLHLRSSGGALIASLDAKKSTFVAAAFSPDSQLLAVESTDGLVRILRGGEVVRSIRTETGAGLAFAGDDFLLTIGKGRVAEWSLPDGRLLRMLAVGKRVSAVAASSDGQTAATLSRGEVRLWNLKTGAPLVRIPERANAIGFSPDSRRLITTYGYRAFLWEVRSGRRLHVLTGHRGTIMNFAFSPDGRQLVTGSLDHDARIWSVTTGRLLAVLRGHFSPIYGVSVGPEGRWVVTAGQVTVGLWPSASGQLLFYLRGPSAQLTGVSFSADGRSILAGSLDGSAYLYHCDVCGKLTSLEALAKQRLARAPASGG